MEVGREALTYTNPGARYVVLTDRETAPSLENEFEIEVLAPTGEPLMRQYVMAQIAYEKQAEPGLVVLAATDCAPVRDLSDSLQHNMAVTYRDTPRGPVINNVAYIVDHDRASWFLERSLGMMRPSKYEFGGDQESWQAALGPSQDWLWLDDGTVRACPDGRWIHLYPFRSHNYFVKRNGAFNNNAKKAYLVHYKGTRKYNMVDSVGWYILNKKDFVPNFKLKPDERPVLPMRERRRK